VLPDLPPPSSRDALRPVVPAPAGEQPVQVAPPPEVPARAAPPPTGEQDFRDGLRALMAGNPQQAVAALDRACGISSSSQMDICYWAAVAWLRAGDRERARQGFAGVVARWPGSTHIGEANVALGWLLLEAGDRTAARARFAAAGDDRIPSVRAEALRGLAAAQ